MIMYVQHQTTYVTISKAYRFTYELLDSIDRPPQELS